LLTRLQKYLADCGICSRRKAEDLIAQGRVLVNGQPALIGCQINPETDKIILDGNPVKKPPTRVWLMLHKPEGYITSAKDQFNRKTVLDLLSGIHERVFPVGRLDYDTTGLLLLTNDGELSNKLTHPKYNVEKVYYATVAGKPSAEAMFALQNGVIVDGRKTRRARVGVIEEKNGSFVLEIAIAEGRNRIVRKMCSAVGHEVIALKRVSFGGLRLGELEKGKYRYLTRQEIENMPRL
jgi:23S rRNA pseudouridine2605 synthase